MLVEFRRDDLAHAVTERVLRANAPRGRPRHRLAVFDGGAWGSVNQEPFPWTRADIVAVTEVLRELDERWQALGPDETLPFPWPKRLVLPAPR